MKIFKIVATLALTLAVGAVCISCDKGDDEGKTPASYLKWNGTEYPVVLAQNWINTVDMKDRFLFRTSTAAFSTNPDQVHFFVEIPTDWTNGYRNWSSVSTTAYKVDIKLSDYEILMTPSTIAALPMNQRPSITGGQIAVTGGTSGYDIAVTMSVRYFDTQLQNYNTGNLELYYNGVTTFNPGLATYLEEDPKEDPNAPW
jgi:hypothetical protein